MTKKCYIVCKLGYEYNDEIMYRPESEGVEPEMVFFEKEKALEAAQKRNIREFRSIEPNEYCYDLEDITSHGEDDFNKIVEGIGTWEEFDDQSVNIDDLEDNQVVKVMEAFDKLRFFEVREVKVDG